MTVMADHGLPVGVATLRSFRMRLISQVVSQAAGLLAIGLRRG
jgi:hypothetical protein